MANAKPEKDHRKPCSLCQTPRDVLVRCQIDESGKWHFVCPGVCWKRVSGGVVDGDKSEEHKWYRYGGMWKNKHEGASARMPRKVKKGQREKRKALAKTEGGETREYGTDEAASVTDEDTLDREHVASELDA